MDPNYPTKTLNLYQSSTVEKSGAALQKSFTVDKMTWSPVVTKAQ